MSESERPAPAPNDEIDAFNDQARWLLEWHNKRSDAFSARSVALLGFTGVILALLPRGLDLNLDATVGIHVSLIATAVLLLLTAFFCLLTLAPKKSDSASIEELRELWRDYADGKNGPRPQAQMTERLLHGRSMHASSPVDIAFREANSRSLWFTWAVVSLGVALVALATLVVQVFWQI